MDYSAYLKPGETLESVSVNVLKKRKHDQKLREAKASNAPSDIEWVEEFYDSPARAELQHYLGITSDLIAQELGQEDLSDVQDEPVRFMLLTSYSYAHRLVKKTTSGPMAAWLFPDVIGGCIVAGRHRFDLTRSKTFADLYWPLLKLLDANFGKNVDSSDQVFKQNSLIVKQELAGKFVL